MNQPQGRFEKSEHAHFGGKLRNRYNPIAPHTRSDAPGDFLARLWTLFGPPSSVIDDGFLYHLVDRATGMPFDAYSGASGPAYAGRPQDAKGLLPVLDALDRLLDNTPLADCVVEYGRQGSQYRVGAIDGQPFEELVAVDETQFEAAVMQAEQILAEQNGDFWDYCNGAVELVAWRKRFQKSGGRSSTDRYSRTLHRLWLEALNAAERFTERAAGRAEAVHEGDIEPIMEVGLVQLTEIGEQGNWIDEEYSQRLRRVDTELRRLMEP